jgi:tRNA threonylcarbamoyladenosine biosynthesis protein TsaB
MSCILHIETSTKACSVALSENGQLIFHKEDLDGPNHAVVCGVYVDEALSFANSHAIPVDAVAVSEGPGSYTGLRIGVSLAKGVCYGRDLPLLSVPTLKLLCVPVLLGKEELPEEALLVPMIDARRMEVYSAVYDRALREVRPVGADIVEADTYLSYLEEHPVYFFGNGAMKCQSVIQHKNARFIDGIIPLAKWMFPLAERSLHLGEKQDVAYFEPFYLKEFVAIKSKNLL